MKQRPILFSAPMVRALLDGSKTQTRRVAKIKRVDAHPQNPIIQVATMEGVGKQFWANSQISHPNHISKACPHGQVGDQLWVRETWCDVYGAGGNEHRRKKEVMYRADGETDPNVVPRWTPPIHMPRWASRITLEITGVRVERLQDITAADALAEGIVQAADGGYHLADTRHYSDSPDESYASLWEHLNGEGSWNSNPWVWVIEFKKVKP
jgi:hypothetical protein